MKVICKKCTTVITKEIILYKGNSFGEAAEQPYIQAGYYTVSQGDFFTGTQGFVIGNLDDLINTKYHSDKSRLNGCCGLDGLDGSNIICSNGHEVGTEKSDCWMPFAILFEKDKIILTEE